MKSRGGFTLVELLLTTGIISILATGLIVAVNPVAQLTGGRDAERRHNARELEQAQMQYLIDQGSYAGDKTIPEDLANALPVCRSGKVDASCINIDILISTFLACIPYDGQETNPLHTGYSAYLQAGRVRVVPLYLGTGPVAGGCEQPLRPIAHWKFDETSIGATAIDASGNGHHASPSGFASPQGPSAEIPPVHFSDPRSLRFDGSNDYLSLTTTSMLNLNKIFTLAAWIYIDTIPDDLEILMRSDGSGGNEFNLAVEDDNKLGVHIDGTTYESNSTLPTGQWLHVAGVRNGSSLKLYINGVLDKTHSTTKNTNFGSCTTLHIGTDIDSGGNGCTTPRGNYWRGKLDDVRIYNIAFTDAQIAALAAGNP